MEPKTQKLYRRLYMKKDLTFEEAIQYINCIKPKVISQEIIYETE